MASSITQRVRSNYALWSVLLILLVATSAMLLSQTMVQASTESRELAQTETTYVVQRGDTLYAIARRFNLSVDDLMRLNGLSNPNFIYIGQELIVAESSSEGEINDEAEPTVVSTATPQAEPTATTTITVEPTPTATPTPTASTTTIYTVRRGDSLSAIARRFSTTTAELVRLNNLRNANVVVVGQQLRVPVVVGEREQVQEPIRINFATGATSATVDGTVIFPDRICYVLEAAAGQEMRVTITAGSNLANFSVQAADSAVNGGVPLKRLENEDRRWRSILPTSGDYLLCVATAAGAVTYNLTVTIPASCTSITQAIQTVDWEAFLPTDTDLDHEEIGGDHYVTVSASSTGVAGIPQLEQIVYGDFDGDCQEEAGIPLFSGGTAGNVGFLVYDGGAPTPTLVAWGDGYKLGLEADRGILVVSNALYNGWEPNCCPSGRSFDRYRLDGNTLTLLAAGSEGFDGAREATILHFYMLLANEEYASAYALLSPAFQSANPFAAWEAGYANTESITATVEPDSDTENRLAVELEVQERLSSGATRVRYFSGYWDVTWDASAPGWILQNGRFVVVP